jgi:hypothetical protein
VSPPPPTRPTTRAFVVQVRAPPAGAARGWAGRVEPVVAGQATPFHSLEELLACICRVLTDVPTPS